MVPITAHTTQFATPGWFYLQHDYGVGLLDHGGSIVTLVSPGSRDLTIVIETMVSLMYILSSVYSALLFYV